MFAQIADVPTSPIQDGLAVVNQHILQGRDYCRVTNGNYDTSFHGPLTSRSS